MGTDAFLAIEAGAVAAGAADTADVVVAGSGADALTAEPGATAMGARAGEGDAGALAKGAGYLP